MSGHYKWYVGFLLRQLFPRNNSNSYSISYSISISYSTSHCAPHVSQCASYGAQGVITLVVQGFSDTGGTMWASSPTDSTENLIDFHQQKSPGGAYRRDDVSIVPYRQHGNPRRFPPTKIPRRGIQAAAAAVTLPFSQLKLGRKVSGDSPPAVTLPFSQLRLGGKVSGDPPRG